MLRHGLLRAFRSSAARKGFSTALEESVIVTKGCSKRIKHLQSNAKNNNLYLRVSVNGGGCSGYQYNFNMEQDEIDPEEDQIFERDDAKVVVDKTSLGLIKGATVDYVQEMIKSAFAVINNPQSESACGCGSSFAVKNFSANPALD